MRQPLIHPLLDAAIQVKARRYELEKRLIGVADSIVSVALMLFIYWSGFSHWLAFTPNLGGTAGAVLIYSITLIALTFLIGLPLSYYSGYLHEQRWEFSNHTPKSWLWDQLKGLLVSLILTPALLGLLLWIMYLTPQYWWLVAAVATAVVSVILATLVPVAILPLFNKYEPVEDEELVRRLTVILTRSGLRPSGFFVEDMSRQTKKENAFLAGMGKTRRVVLGDNLLNNMQTAEIESVIAHEVGHYKHRHIWKNILIGTLQQFLLFYLISLLFGHYQPHYLESTRHTLAVLPLMILAMSILSAVVFAPPGNWISRWFERQADRVALAEIDDKRDFLTAMAGLANRNLSNAYPAPWVKIMYYSHPPIGERLALGEEW